ncbi:hypothetical protein CNMCM6069_009677 [Aspergillus lentulus]|nr:hypothetical protein CNMCM6069_009677 [Aspergillus lentulus]
MLPTDAAAAANATRLHQQGCQSTSSQTSVVEKDGMNRSTQWYPLHSLATKSSLAMTKTQTANGYLATVSMRSTLPSGESIVLPFAAPDILRAAFTDEEEEIAKNNIAVYVLFCIGEHNSDLPRGWRGLWKRELERIKAVDVKEGRGWMYSGDLFGEYKRWQDSLYDA